MVGFWCAMIVITCFAFEIYRGTSLIRNCNLLGPYSRTVPRATIGGVLFLMSEVPL